MPLDDRAPRRLFVAPGSLASDRVTITGPDHRHLALVLRARKGDPLTLLDGCGRARRGTVAEVGRSETLLDLGADDRCPPDPPLRLTVAQAAPKGDRFSEVVQHGTEAGAWAFVPLLTERGVVRLDARDAEGRTARWQAVAKGAAEQSGRGSVPAVLPPAPLAQMVRDWGADCLVLHPGGVRLSEAIGLAPGLRAGGAACLAVGPEGGFTEREIDEARRGGAAVVSIGPYVFRSETAAVAAVAILLDRIGRGAA